MANSVHTDKPNRPERPIRQGRKVSRYSPLLHCWVNFNALNRLQLQTSRAINANSCARDEACFGERAKAHCTAIHVPDVLPFPLCVSFESALNRCARPSRDLPRLQTPHKSRSFTSQLGSGP
jgi:hypothetical protein